MQELRDGRPERSGALSQPLLGKIRLETAKADIGRPRYAARTSLDALSGLAPPAGPGRPGRRFGCFAMVEAVGVEPDDDEPNPPEDEDSSS